MVFTFDVAKAIEIGRPLIIFVIGIVLYSVFIFKFYRFLAKKDIFELDLERYNTASMAWLKKSITVIFYIIKYILLFPLFTFFWFIMMTLFLILLSDNQSITTILLLSIALVSAVRVTAYYNEDLSKDLAKMLPFALLGIFLINVGAFSWEESWNLITQIPPYLNSLIYYLIFVIGLEIILRIVNAFISPFREEEKK